MWLDSELDARWRWQARLAMTIIGSSRNIHQLSTRLLFAFLRRLNDVCESREHVTATYFIASSLEGGREGRHPGIMFMHNMPYTPD